MNNLNFTQRQYLKRLMDLIIDYKDFNSLPLEVIVALSFMTETKTTDKALKDDVNSFMNAYDLQKTFKAKREGK
jgi:hypothetical protein